MEGDIPAPVLSKLLVGHSRLIMTLYYTKITPMVMRAKMEEAEERARMHEQESLQAFLEDSELRQIEECSIYNDMESVSNVLKVRNPAGWQEKSIGLCLVGGNTSRSEETIEIGGCWNGGEQNRRATTSLTKVHNPVPHGTENCIRCRWFITDARYLFSLTAHFNNLSYQASLSAKLAAQLEKQKDELLDERYFCIEQEKPFTQQEKLESLERRWERQVTDADEYCKDMIACFQIIKKILLLEEQRGAGDNSDKVVSVGSEEDIRQHVGFFETDSTLWQLMQICEDAEIYPDLTEELKKTPAILDRSNKLNYLLMHNNYAPIFMGMDEQMQLIAGNAMVRAMALKYKGKSKSDGFAEVANYIEAQRYLVDSGLLEKGINELSESLNIPVIKLSELQTQNNERLKNDFN